MLHWQAKNRESGLGFRHLVAMIVDWLPALVSVLSHITAALDRAPLHLIELA